MYQSAHHDATRAHHGAHVHLMERHAACTRSPRRPVPPSLIRYERTLPIHLTTCSERLRLWYTSVLRPRRVGLTLVLADVYKATWDDELHPTETERKVMRPDCHLIAYLISSDGL